MNLCELKVSVVYIANSRQVGLHNREILSENKQANKNNEESKNEMDDQGTGRKRKLWLNTGTQISKGKLVMITLKMEA